MNARQSHRSARFRRIPWLCLAWCSLGLGAAGVVLPLLPTTPFLLLAAWAAPKGSPYLGQWLNRHSHFGPLLSVWRKERAIPARAKYFAIIALTSSWILLWWIKSASSVLWSTGLLYLIAGTFLLTRPTSGRNLDND